MKELIIKTKHDKITIPDKNDIIEALEEKADDTDLANVAVSTRLTADADNIVDLNTIVTMGFYHCEQDSYAPYIIHCPKSNGTTTPYTNNKAFFLLVEDWSTNTCSCKQTLTYYNDNTTFVRTKTNSSTWSSWKRFDTNSDTYDRNRYAALIVAGEALTSGTLIYGSPTGRYYKIESGGILDIRYPILCNGSNVPKNEYSQENYNIFPLVDLQTTLSEKTVTPHKMVYLEGTLNEGLFTISSDVFVSDNRLSNNKYYIPLGTSFNENAIYFNSFEGKIVYKNTSTHGLVPVGYSYDDLLDKPTYTAATLKDPNAHTEAINTVANATQTSINSAIDSAIDEINDALNNMDVVPVLVTYTDNTTETLKLFTSLL